MKDREIEDKIIEILSDCTDTDYLSDSEGNESPFTYIDKYTAAPALLYWIKQNFIPKP